MARFDLPSGVPERPTVPELLEDLIDLDDPVQCANIEALLALIRIPGAFAALTALVRTPEIIPELIATADANKDWARIRD